ncbi:MAG TPA: glycosyltransferase family 2 protein [Vicinamibacterales bacterium]|nr:glycosyltransferase family 2 protein [Vicinamibacterales bacterium]
MISIVTPAFNEAGNLQRLHARIVDTMGKLGVDWEWIVVDDHSRDDTFAVIQRLSSTDPRVRGVRLARNSGSHVAIACGLRLTSGDAVVMMASDLQDPPETIGAMLERWRRGAQIVWAVRRSRPGDHSHAWFAAAYYWIVRNVVGLREMPAKGTDFFLADRRVVDAFRAFPERTTSLFNHLTWMGFTQEYVDYEKQPRTAGASGWTLARKIRLVIDSVTAFSNAPLRWCAYLGAAMLAVALVLTVAGIRLLPELGGGLLLVMALLFALSGVQMLALAIVGEYVWSALAEARRRPQFVIEAATSDDVLAMTVK